jgi:phage capsid family
MASTTFGNVRISELQGRADFADLMVYGLNPLLLEGANEEPSQFETIFQRFELTRNHIPFPTYKGLVVGKIEEGQEIPFISLGTGTQTISAEDYGVRCGFTHQMIRDDQVDVMKYTTMELGKAHTRTKNRVAFAALESGAGNSNAATISGTLAIKDIRDAKKAAAQFKEDGTNIPRPVHFTHLIMNPDQQDDLIPDTLDKTPPGIVLDPNTGDIRGVAGLSVIVTAWVTPGVALLVRAKDKLLYCVREELKLDRTENFANAAEEVRTLEAYTFAVLYGDNVYKITGC